MEKTPKKNNKKKIIPTTLAFGLALNALTDKAPAQEIRKDDPKIKAKKERKLTVNYQKQARAKLEQEMGKKIIFPERLSEEDAEQIAEARKDLLETIKTQGEEIRQAPAFKRRIEEDYPDNVVMEASAQTKIDEQLAELIEEAERVKEEMLGEMEQMMTGDLETPRSDSADKKERASFDLKGLDEKYKGMRNAYSQIKISQQKEIIQKMKDDSEKFHFSPAGDLTYSLEEGSRINLDSLLDYYFTEPLQNQLMYSKSLYMNGRGEGRYVCRDSSGKEIDIEKIEDYANNQEGHDFMRELINKALESKFGEFKLTEGEKEKLSEMSNFLVDKAMERKPIGAKMKKVEKEYKEALGMSLLNSPNGNYFKLVGGASERKPSEVADSGEWKYALAINPEMIPDAIAKKLLKVEGEFDWDKIDDYRKTNLRFALARNMRESRGEYKGVAETDVVNEAKRLLEERENVRSVEIFKNRPVLAVFSTEANDRFPIKWNGINNALNLLSGKDMTFDKSMTETAKDCSKKIAPIFKDIILLEKELLSSAGVDISKLSPFDILTYKKIHPGSETLLGSKGLTKEKKIKAREIAREIGSKINEVSQIISDSLADEDSFDSDFYSMFYSENLMKKIKKEKPVSLDKILVSDRVLGQEKVRLKEEEISKKIRELPVPATFLFGMHGVEGSGALAPSRSGSEIVITPEKLFEAYKERDLKLNPSPEERDIFILGSCYSSNFRKQFHQLCDKEGVPKPFFAGEVALNHMGYAEPDSRFNNSFYDKVVFNKSVKGPATLGNLIDFDHLNINSNPNFWGADDENHSMQFSDAREFDELEGGFGERTLPV